MSSIRRGEIYLVNFGKKYNSEFGKIRPALIIQNDIANRNIDLVAFKGVTVLPLTTQLSAGDIRVMIKKRDALEQNSEICINELCTLDLSRIDETQKCTVLNPKELEEVESKLKRHLGIA
ncbi:type II toxin-antitoxin system PemK/MazF family toxin [Sulfuricurvum sp.]|uniref:type II toxin-antitoxin system PemK/MazF family toxin n=1 Tax=Sulfuricurvum sp. TaxID=2025608 RepID=UPI00262C96C1|nr:type II toxin-antitoxin system PemK/MazF family toxin [Sulfuricurvum sp.]MDD4883015.1 type II toxin-antitoxin system PemK/MazF family toxin [Sulfuricurvum sp.]